MDPKTQSHLDAIASAHAAAAPSDWVRIVLWCGRLLDGGEPTGFTYPAVAATFGDHGLGQEYITAGSALASVDPQALDTAVAGTADEGWTVLRFELDRDGTQRADVSHEEARQLDDSATDPFWDDVHEYVQRNGPDLEQLVARLREKGELPGAHAGADAGATAGASADGADDAGSGGRLGKLFGRR